MHVSTSEQLAARAQRGDRDARAALVEEQMGLVRSVALRYRDLGVPVDDLVQEGVVGLLSAIDRYDPSRAAAFSTYAFWRVRASVTHALTAQIRTGEGDARVRVVSLDQPDADGEPLSTRLADPAEGPEAQLERREQSRTLHRALRRLRPRKSTIVSRHFGLGGAPESFRDIARDLELSEERTRALNNKALRELSAALGTRP